jgi:glutamate-1-semialdehyde 2,1-aminomutase/spore coat polysaccharide biosynthesis protein SpsF
VPESVRALTSTFAFNDLDDLERALSERSGAVAAVILEPSGLDVPAPGFLQGVVDLARAHGAVSVFDEIITGFRIAPGGARERYGVEPDLSCYGKALGNGMPISAVAGTWTVMRAFEDVFFSGTHGGEALSLAAARAVLDAVADGGVLAQVEKRGQRMLKGVADLVLRHGVGARVRVGGEPQRTIVAFSGPDHLVVKSWVQQSLVERGVLFNGSMLICARHTDEDVDRALGAFDAAFSLLSGGTDVGPMLKGPAVQAVFRAP